MLWLFELSIFEFVAILIIMMGCFLFLIKYSEKEIEKIPIGLSGDIVWAQMNTGFLRFIMLALPAILSLIYFFGSLEVDSSRYNHIMSKDIDPKYLEDGKITHIEFERINWEREEIKRKDFVQKIQSKLDCKIGEKQ